MLGYTMLRVCDGCKDVLDTDQNGLSVSTTLDFAQLKMTSRKVGGFFLNKDLSGSGSSSRRCSWCGPAPYSNEPSGTKGLTTREAGRGHATPHVPVETAKCWWLLKIEPKCVGGSS